jgi:ankyrin repeat protein
VKEFIDAVSNGDLDAVRRMLARDPGLSLCRADSGETAIQRAVYWGREDVAEVLKAAAPPLDMGTACTVGDQDRVRNLLEEDRSRANKVTPDGFLPLCLALAFAHMDVARLLAAAGADVNARSIALGGVAPIHSAVFGRNAEGVRWLLENGADVNAAQEGGFTALHGACQNGDVRMVEDLLSSGADVTLRTDEGKQAADFSNPEVAERLAAHERPSSSRP